MFVLSKNVIPFTSGVTQKSVRLSDADEFNVPTLVLLLFLQNIISFTK